MKQQNITICGKQYPVVFNLGTMMSFEEISGKSFFSEDFGHIRERVALILAAVISADSETGITFDDIVKSADFKEMAEAFNIVSELSVKYFNIPAVVQQSEEAEAPKNEAPKGKKPKN